MYQIKRTDAEINDLLNEAGDKFEATTSEYAEGVMDAIRWACGDTEDRPVLG